MPRSSKRCRRVRQLFLKSAAQHARVAVPEQLKVPYLKVFLVALNLQSFIAHLLQIVQSEMFPHVTQFAPLLDDS